MAEPHRRLEPWTVQVPGWTLLLYLVVAQGIAAFSYELGVAMGTQEPVAIITEVGAAFWYGFAFGDLVVYIPLLCAGLVGLRRGRSWGRALLTAALGITIYWPLACLAAMVTARDAPGWHLASEAPYWVVCVLIAAWGVWALALTVRDDRWRSLA